MTLLSAAIIFAITTMEFFDYRRVNVDTSIVVDKSRGEKLTVKMNVTFPRVPCYCESHGLLQSHPACFTPTSLSMGKLQRLLQTCFTSYVLTGSYSAKLGRYGYQWGDPKRYHAQHLEDSA